MTPPSLLLSLLKSKEVWMFKVETQASRMNDSLQPTCNGLQPKTKSDGLQPTSDGLYLVAIKAFSRQLQYSSE